MLVDKDLGACETGQQMTHGTPNLFQRPSMNPMLTFPGPMAFVLGGGGGLGATQVGMLQALQMRGIKPDFVIGTSVGALNAAVLAAHPNDAAERLSDLWLSIKQNDVFDGHLVSALWTLGRSHTHLLKTDSLATLLKQAMEATTFAELELPLGVVAVNMAAGQAQLISDGPLIPALLASSAIPGIFPPVAINGQPMVDGGILANLPITQASTMATFGTLVLLDCTVPAPTVPTSNVVEIITHANQLQFRDQIRAALPAVTPHTAVVSLPSPSARQVSMFDFNQTAVLIDDARAATADFLDSLTPQRTGLQGDPFSRYIPGAVPRPC